MESDVAFVMLGLMLLLLLCGFCFCCCKKLYNVGENYVAMLEKVMLVAGRILLLSGIVMMLTGIIAANNMMSGSIYGPDVVILLEKF